MAQVEMASMFLAQGSIAGRRRFFERLEMRAREEPAGSCGAKLAAGQSLQSILSILNVFSKRGVSGTFVSFTAKERCECPTGPEKTP